MTQELLSTLEATRIECPPLRHYMPGIMYVIQIALGGFVICLSVTDRTMSWEAHEHDQQFGENETTDIGKCQRLQKERNARMNKGLAMRPGVSKVILKVQISRYFDSPETDLEMAANACCVDVSDTWSSKLVHWAWTTTSQKCTTTYDRCEHIPEFHCGVTLTNLPIVTFHPKVAQ